MSFASIIGQMRPSLSIGQYFQLADLRISNFANKSLIINAINDILNSNLQDNWPIYSLGMLSLFEDIEMYIEQPAFVSTPSWGALMLPMAIARPDLQFVAVEPDAQIACSLETQANLVGLHNFLIYRCLNDAVAQNAGLFITVAGGLQLKEKEELALMNYWLAHDNTGHPNIVLLLSDLEESPYAQGSLDIKRWLKEPTLANGYAHFLTTYDLYPR